MSINTEYEKINNLRVKIMHALMIKDVFLFLLLIIYENNYNDEEHLYSALT